MCYALFLPLFPTRSMILLFSLKVKNALDQPDSSLHDKNNGSVEHQTLVSKDEFSDICNSVPVNECLVSYICSHAFLTWVNKTCLNWKYLHYEKAFGLSLLLLFLSEAFITIMLSFAGKYVASEIFRTKKQSIPMRMIGLKLNQLAFRQSSTCIRILTEINWNQFLI